MLTHCTQTNQLYAVLETKVFFSKQTKCWRLYGVAKCYDQSVIG